MENDKELLDRLVCACDVGHDCPRRKVVAQALQAAYRAGQEAMRLRAMHECNRRIDAIAPAYPDAASACQVLYNAIKRLPIEDKP